MYEHRSRPLLSGIEFLFRVIRHGLFASGIVFFALGIGILGYHGFEGMTWIDATLNASMILGGMGPVNPLNTEGGKLFASAYALFLVWFSSELWALSLLHLPIGYYIHSIWKLVMTRINAQ